MDPREKLIRGLLKENPHLPFRVLMSECKAKLGKSLSMAQIAVLRRSLGIASKRPAPKAGKKKAAKGAAKRGPGRPKGAAKRGPGRPKGAAKRGPGRPKGAAKRGPGRPKGAAGKAAKVAAHGGVTHIVGIRAGRGIKTSSFRSRSAALAKIEALLGKGTPPSAIQLFSESQLEISMQFRITSK